MNTLFDKHILKEHTMNINGDDFECYILKDSDGYYNVHILDEYYRREELNTLKLQEPMEAVQETHFTKAQMECYILDHYLWHKFGNRKGDDSVYSYSIEEHKD